VAAGIAFVLLQWLNAEPLLASEPAPQPIVRAIFEGREQEVSGRYYPADLLLRRIEGEVALTCAVAFDGRLDCIANQAANSDLVAVALSITNDFRIAPREGGVVEMLVSFGIAP